MSMSVAGGGGKQAVTYEATSYSSTTSTGDPLVPCPPRTSNLLLSVTAAQLDGQSKRDTRGGKKADSNQALWQVNNPAHSLAACCRHVGQLCPVARHKIVRLCDTNDSLGLHTSKQANQEERIIRAPSTKEQAGSTLPYRVESASQHEVASQERGCRKAPSCGEGGHGCPGALCLAWHGRTQRLWGG